MVDQKAEGAKVKFSKEQLNDKLASNPALARRNPNLDPSRGEGVRPRPGVEEQHVQHRQQRKPRVEKAVRQTFSVAITLYFADYRTRDADAALSTLLDCVIAARRQLENHTGDFNRV
jgi:hypothetical protein